MKKIESYINQQINDTKHILTRTLKEIIEQYPHPELLRDFIQPAQKIITEGKFIRPKFCLLGDITSNTNTDSNSLQNACTALELYHLSALIHDDIIDNTKYRRKELSAHIQLSNISADKEKNIFGVNAAILLGDLLLSKAFEHIHKITSSSFEQYKDITSYFSQITQEVALGQYYDLFASNNPVSENYLLNKDLIKNILISKTAHYTVGKPFILGTKFSAHQTTNTNLFEQALVYWGIAFQMKDDELGIFGDPNKTGKSSGVDLIEEKKTLLLAYTLEKLDIEERKNITETLPALKSMHAEEQSESIQEIKNEIITSGAYTYHQEQMNDNYIKGCNIIDNIPMNDEVKEYLFEFGNTLISREK